MADMDATRQDEQTRTRIPIVHFSDTASAIFVPHIWELTKEERNAIWYSERENAKIQTGILKTLKRMRRGVVDEERYCSRGLEHMGSSSNLEGRKRDRAAVYNAVLSEQRRQQVCGISDPLKIREASTECTKGPREKALQLADSDAQHQIGSNRSSQLEYEACASMLDDVLKLTGSIETQESGVETKIFSSMENQTSSRDNTTQDFTEIATAVGDSHLSSNAPSGSSAQISRCQQTQADHPSKMSTETSLLSLVSRQRTKS